MTLEQLFQAYCDGDQQAFDSIDKHLRPLLLAVISSKGIDKATADDVVQATMLKVIRHRQVRLHEGLASRMVPSHGTPERFGSMAACNQSEELPLQHSGP